MRRIRPALIDALVFARGYTIPLLDTIPEADWFVMPAGCPSHVAWQVGHLAFAEARLVVERVGGRAEVGGGRPAAEFVKLFARNSVPDASPAGHPGPAEIRRVLDRVHTAALQMLRDTRDDDLETTRCPARRTGFAERRRTMPGGYRTTSSCTPGRSGSSGGCWGRGRCGDMKCDQCDGYGMLADAADRPPWPVWEARAPPEPPAAPVPCPRCGGTGVSHCCEGDRCHPGDPE